MNLPSWLLRYLPMFDYICPKCNRDVPKASEKCPYCGEHYKEPLRVPPKVLKDRKTLEEYVHKHVFPKVSSERREYLAKFFTILFQDGFESGDFSAWNSTSVGGSGSTLTVQSTVKHHGSYAAASHVEAAAGYANCFKFFSAVTEAYARCYLYFTALPSSNGSTLFIGPSLAYNGIDFVSLEVKNDGGTVKWQLALDGFSIFYLASTGPTTNTWYCVEIYGKAGSAGAAKLWINGSLVLDIARSISTAYFHELGMGCWNRSGATNATVYLDCVAVADIYIGEEGITLVEVADAVGLSTLCFCNKALALLDSLALADSFCGDKKFLLSDYASLSELANVMKSVKASDTLTLNDYSLVPLRFSHVLEAIGLTDNIAALKVLQVTDAVALVEVVASGAGGAKKTRLFLLIGDLAVQLTSE